MQDVIPHQRFIATFKVQRSFFNDPRIEKFEFLFGTPSLRAFTQMCYDEGRQTLKKQLCLDNIRHFTHFGEEQALDILETMVRYRLLSKRPFGVYAVDPFLSFQLRGWIRHDGTGYYGHSGGPENRGFIVIEDYVHPGGHRNGA
jgi:hypothetical protein